MKNVSNTVKKLPAPHHVAEAGGLVIRLGRQSFSIPSIHARTKTETEQLAWNLKQIMFDRGIISNLGGGH